MACVSPKALVTAVALDWPRISRQFSVEVGFSIPDEGCTFPPLGHVWLPHDLVKRPTKVSASNDTQQLPSPEGFFGCLPLPVALEFVTFFPQAPQPN